MDNTAEDNLQKDQVKTMTSASLPTPPPPPLDQDLKIVREIVQRAVPVPTLLLLLTQALAVSGQTSQLHYGYHCLQHSGVRPDFVSLLLVSVATTLSARSDLASLILVSVPKQSQARPRPRNEFVRSGGGYGAGLKPHH